MTDDNKTPMGNILDAQDRLSDAGNLAELIRMSQLGEISDPEARAISHAAYMITLALDDASALITRAKEQMGEGEAA